MSKPVAFIEQTIIFDPVEAFSHMYQFEAKFAEFLRNEGLEAEVMEPYGGTTRRVLFIRKIEEIAPQVPVAPAPPIGPQEKLKDLKKGLK